MKRRNLLCQAPAWLLAPTIVQAQSGPKLLVVLTSTSRTSAMVDVETEARQELTRLGWRVGDNLRVEFRYGDDRPERADAVARELIAMQPAAALAWDEPALLMLLRHTKQVPMVTAYSTDPVAIGLAASLRRPGGQVTGLSAQFADIRPKTYELARQVAPSARRLAGMFDRRIIPAAQFDAAMAGLSRIAQQVGLEYLPLPVRDVGEIEAALRSLTPVREHVLLLNVDTLIYPNFATIAALARTLRLPSGSQAHEYAKAGGLFSYGPEFSAMRLRAVQMVDQVLRGQPVGEIPFEQPTRITLTLNQATAKSIGLTFPREFLLRADEMIG
jgi:putative tryptophan/tyrosine transport system substrate-binding protein